MQGLWEMDLPKFQAGSWNRSLRTLHPVNGKQFFWHVCDGSYSVSSATTVMVVGFVNSGIMKLTQAVGIIMGANIGTTITSWILSLTGIESSNFFISLLKPSSFTNPRNGRNYITDVYKKFPQERHRYDHVIMVLQY